VGGPRGGGQGGGQGPTRGAGLGPGAGGESLLVRYEKFRQSFASAAPLLQALLDGRGAPVDPKMYDTLGTALNMATHHLTEIQAKSFQRPAHKYRAGTRPGSTAAAEISVGVSQYYDSAKTMYARQDLSPTRFNLEI